MMMTNLNLGRIIPSSERLGGVLSSFQRWWLQEFQALFANRFGPWLLGSRRQTLQLEPMLDAVHIVLSGADELPEQSARIDAEDYSRSALDGFLGAKKLLPAEWDVTLRLPFEHFFGRKLTLPTAAISSLDEIVMRDMAKKT